MAGQDGILGEVASVSGDQSAIDNLSRRQAESEAQRQSAQEFAESPHPSQPTLMPSSPPAQLSRPDFEQNYFQGLVDSKQGALVNEILSMKPRQQEAYIASAYDAELARMAPPPNPGPTMPAANNAPAQISYVSPYISPPTRWQGLNDELTSPQGLDDERLFRDLYGPRTQSQSSSFLTIPTENAEPPTDEEAGSGRAAGFGARAKANWQNPHNRQAMAFGIGYSAMGLGSGVEALQRLGGGEFITSEQYAATETSAFLPGAAGLIGTVGGSLVGGMPGALMGQFAGSAIGGVASAGIGAFESRGNAIDRASQSLGEGRGGADAIKEFADALRNAATPAVKDLTDAMARLGQSGPVSAVATSQFAQFQATMGSAFPDNVAAEGRFLESSPFLAPVRATFGRSPLNGLTATDYTGTAAAAAMSGDYGGMKASLAFEEVKAGKDTQNPDYFRDKGVVDRYESKSWAETRWQNIKDSWTGDFGQSGAYDDAQDRLKTEPEYLTRQDKDKAAKAAADARGVEEMYETHQLNIANVSYGVSQTGRDTTRLSNRLLAGGGSGAISSALSGIGQDVSLGITALDKDIELNKQNAEKYPLQKSFFLAQSAADEQQEEQLRSTLPSVKRGYFDLSQAEKSSAYGLTEASANAGIARGFYSGQSYKQLEGREESLFSAETSRAGQLRQDAYNPIVPPAERDKMLAQAAGMETQEIGQRYNFKMAGYAQVLGQADEKIGEAGLGVTQSKLFGGTEAIYGAQSTEIDTLTAKMRELTSEISRGGMSVSDLTGKMRERTGVESQIAQTVAARRDDRLAAADAFAGDQMAIDTAGLPRRTRIGGTGSVDFDQVKTDFQSIFQADQSRIDAFAEGDPRRKGAQAKLAIDQARSRDYEETLANFAPPAQERSGLVQAEGRLDSARHEFRRTMESPYLDGNPESSPFTRGLALEREIGGGIARVDKQAAEETASRQRLQGKVGSDGKPLWDDAFQERYISDMDRFRQKREGLMDERTGIEHDRLFDIGKMFPEMIAGAGGQGVVSGVLPTQGQAAFYNGNPFVSGSFGKPNVPSESGGHTPMPGGPAGAFIMAHSGVSGGTPEAAALMQAAKALSDAAMALRGTPGGRSPAMPSAAGFSQNANLLANTQRSGARW